MTTPKLGFKDSDGREFPEWEEKKLGTFCVKIGSGKTPKGGRKIYCNDGVMLIRSQNVLNGILDLSDVVYITNDINESMLSTILEEHDVLLNITGASIGRCCLYLCDKKANVNQHVCIIRLDKNADIIPEFLLQYILSDCIQNQIKSYQNGGSREGLNFQQISNFIVHRPSLPEQKKIASFLSTIDEIIQSTESELTAWQERKKGVMQKIFNREVRFKSDDGSEFPEWEEKKLGEITQKVVRKADDKSMADVRMISQGNGFILQSKKYSRENAGESLKKYTLLKKNEFAYNHGASKVKQYGVCYRLIESDEARVPYVYHTFRLKKGNEDYWNYALNTSEMDKQLKKMVSSGVRMDGLLNINYETYMSVKVLIPSLPEQKKIAECLFSIDGVIRNIQAELSAWKEFKKGLLQQMFV